MAAMEKIRSSAKVSPQERYLDRPVETFWTQHRAPE
jgi:hypothetical protein